MLKKTFDAGIINQVDLILFEEGVFSPLNWLLREAYLNYRIYQSWRLGEIEYLADHFSKEISQLILLLDQACSYAKSQNLEISTQQYASKAGQQLYFCRAPAYNTIFSTVFKPPQNQVQMDLFYDSALVCTEFDLKKSILNKQVDESSRLLSKIKSSNLEKYQQFLQIITLEKKLLQSELASDQKIKCLQNATALVFEIFGGSTHEFLTPLWQKLSIEIDGQDFNAESPDIHISYTASKGFLWSLVLSSIEKENNWRKQPVLLFRYTEACFKLDKEQSGLANWFRLFILFPEDAEKHIEQSCNQMVFAYWLSFCELEPELSSTLFPAWLVMNKSALAKNTLIAEIKECKVLELVIELVFNDTTEINETVIYLRKKLQQYNANLFHHYMKSNLINSNKTRL